MAYSEPQAPLTRLVGIGFVVLLHAALIYALVTGLAHRAIEVVRVPVVTRIIEETRPSPPEPPPPPLLAPPPPILLPPPEVHIETPPPPKSTAITLPPKPAAPPPQAAPPPAPAAAAEPVRVMPRLDPQHSAQAEYPPVSRELGEQGTAIVQVLVGVDGRALDAKLLRSSGYDRLDRATLASVKEVYRFVPGTVDGKPQPMWFTFKFIWKLQ